MKLSYKRHENLKIPTYKRTRDYRAQATRLETRFRRQIQHMWSRYESGAISLEGFYRWFREHSHQYQVRAYVLGLRASGIMRDRLSDAELRYLHGVHSREMRYMHAFIRDVRAGRGRMPYRRRLDLYGKDLYGTFLMGAFSHPPRDPQTRYYWRLSDAEHCADCIQRAAESVARGGYNYRELMRLGLPGTGRTRCLNNCRCWIEATDSSYRTTPRRARRMVR